MSSMPDQDHLPTSMRRTPWNKGKLIARSLPAVKSSLVDPNAAPDRRRTRDLALFNLAVDRKLRGCDVVALRVEDVASDGYAVDRATVRQKKTGRPVKFELIDQTRQAVDDLLKESGRSRARTHKSVLQ